jgi:hypothetical protein
LRTKPTLSTHQIARSEVTSTPRRIFGTESEPFDLISRGSEVAS